MGDHIQGTPANSDDLGVTMVGAETMRDNHGNSYSGHFVTCAGKKTAPMSMGDEIDLVRNLDFDERLTLFVLPPGHLPMLFGMKSPIQTTCEKLSAEGQLTPLAVPHIAADHTQKGHGK